MSATCSTCVLRHRPMLGLLLLATACTAGANPNISTLIRLAQHPMAVCLDGKPAGYYLRRGTTPEGRRRTYIHHEGGGWCQLQTPLEVWPNDNCEARASTYLGSLEGDNATKAWNATIGCAGCSPDPAVNPLMASWNAVYIRYCDGGTMSGRVVDPVRAANGTELYFRGAFILRAVVDSLALELGADFTLGTDFVIGGSSAGGLAVYLHLDWWRRQLPTAATVAGLADSGFFLDWQRNTTSAHSYDSDLRWGFQAMNYSGGVAACVAAKRAKGAPPSDCAFAGHALPFVRTPVFILQSVYDSWQLQWEHGEHKAPHDFAALNAYGARLSSAIKTAVRLNEQAGGTVGGFVERCYHHCTTTMLWTTRPAIAGITPQEAFGRWYRGLAAGGGGVPPTTHRGQCSGKRRARCRASSVGARRGWSAPGG